MNHNALHTAISRLQLRSPIINASGPMGWMFEYSSCISYNDFGAFTLKGLTKTATKGNAQPRVHITPHGLINSIGLENPGVHAFIRTTLPIIRKTIASTVNENSIRFPLIANINGEHIEEFADIARMLSHVPEIKALEINISCPNVEKGGLAFAGNTISTKKVVRAVCDTTTLPVIVKVPYVPANVQEHIRAVLDGGAEIISMINTLPSMAIHRGMQHTNVPMYGKGGLSGSAIKPLALRMIYETRQFTDIPIIGIGGITTFDDMQDYLYAGANAIAIGTAVFSNHMVFSDITRDMCEYMKQHAISNIPALMKRFSIYYKHHE